jgi:hypothetical protein
MRCRAPFNSDAELASLAAGFLDLSLPEPMWTNDAHWAVAIHLLRHRPDLDLCRDLPGLIRRFNEAKGGQNTDTAGYHETITQASIHMASRALRAAGNAPAYEVVNALMASPTGKTGWLLAHWSKDVLMSPAARRTRVAPDLQPLPETHLHL